MYQSDTEGNDPDLAMGMLQGDEVAKRDSISSLKMRDSFVSHISSHTRRVSLRPDYVKGHRVHEDLEFQREFVDRETIYEKTSRPSLTLTRPLRASYPDSLTGTLVYSTEGVMRIPESKQNIMRPDYPRFVSGTPTSVASHRPAKHIVLPPSNIVPRVVESQSHHKHEAHPKHIKQMVRDAKIRVQNRQSKEHRHRVISRADKIMLPSERSERTKPSKMVSPTPTIFRAVSPTKALRVTNVESKSNVALDCFRLSAKLALRRRRDDQLRRKIVLPARHRQQRVRKEMRVVPTSVSSRHGYVARENFERLSRPHPSRPSRRVVASPVPPPPPPQSSSIRTSQSPSIRHQSPSTYQDHHREASARLERIQKLLIQQHHLPPPPPPSSPLHSTSVKSPLYRSTPEKKSTPEDMRWRSHLSHLQSHDKDDTRRYVEDNASPSSKYSDTVSKSWPQYNMASDFLSHLDSPAGEKSKFLNPLRADKENALLHVDAIRKRMTDTAVEQAILRNTEHYELTRRQNIPKRPYDDYVLHSETCRCMSCWAIKSARNRLY